MSSNRTNRRYSTEFKEEAVALVIEQSYSIRKAAESLWISTGLLYNWNEKVESDRLNEGVCTNEREKLKRLRKEAKDLRMEKEFYKRQAPSLRKKWGKTPVHQWRV